MAKFLPEDHITTIVSAATAAVVLSSAIEVHRGRKKCSSGR